MKRDRSHVTAVQVVCAHGHTAVVVRPEPQFGPVSHLVVETYPARFRSGALADFLGHVANIDEDGWVTVAGTTSDVPVDKLQDAEWLKHATTGCRCGLWRTPSVDVVVRAAWAWSNERKRLGTPPKPRVLQMAPL